MKNYKDFKKIVIGGSDIAALVLVGCTEEGVESHMLNFGQDDSYRAYIVDETAEIGSHYKKVAHFGYWMKVYDDEGLVRYFKAKEINVYRAAEMGCVIQLIKEEK